MTAFPGSIDLTEAGQGVKFTMNAGSGGVTAGQPVKIDTTAYEVIACTATSDVIVGFARDTVSSGSPVTVLSDGCLVLTPYTLTGGDKVGVGSGVAIDWSTGTIIGYTVKAATTASVVRVQIQY